MPVVISKSIEVWSTGRYYVKKTPEIEAEVKKVCDIWRESNDMPGYNPWGKLAKMKDYQSDNYSIGCVTEHTGVECVVLYKDEKIEADATLVWYNYGGKGYYEVEKTPEIETEVNKVLALYRETKSMDKSDLFNLAKKMDEYNTPGFILGYSVRECGLNFMFLYKVNTP